MSRELKVYMRVQLQSAARSALQHLAEARVANRRIHEIGISPFKGILPGGSDFETYSFGPERE
jgi:hypothetical protein